MACGYRASNYLQQHVHLRAVHTLAGMSKLTIKLSIMHYFQSGSQRFSSRIIIPKKSQVCPMIQLSSRSPFHHTLECILAWEGSYVTVLQNTQKSNSCLSNNLPCASFWAIKTVVVEVRRCRPSPATSALQQCCHNPPHCHLLGLQEAAAFQPSCNRWRERNETSIYTHARMHRHVRTCTRSRAYTHKTHTHTHTHTRAHTHTLPRTHACTHTHTHTHTRHLLVEWQWPKMEKMSSHEIVLANPVFVKHANQERIIQWLNSQSEWLVPVWVETFLDDRTSGLRVASPHFELDVWVAEAIAVLGNQTMAKFKVDENSVCSWVVGLLRSGQLVKRDREDKGSKIKSPDCRGWGKGRKEGERNGWICDSEKEMSVFIELWQHGAEERES